MNTTTSQQVTSEQLAACSRIIDDASGEVFYRVQSASSSDEYSVHFVAYEDGSVITTCTCRAGQMRVACWHIHAALAHNALQAEAQLPIGTGVRTLALANYRARDHLIKIKSKDGSLHDYLPSAWRFYELSLKYPDANFSTELLFFDLERNFWKTHQEK